MSKQYFLTLTLNPGIYNMTPTQQLELTEKKMYNHFQPNTYVSELTKLGNIHYHLLLTSGRSKIDMHTYVKEFIHANFKLYGKIYDLKIVVNEVNRQHYVEYMNKNPYNPISSVS